MAEKLNRRQQRFVHWFCKKGVAYEAYKHAGYKIKDKESGYAAASRLLNRPEIIEAIEQRQKELDEELIAKEREIKRYWTAEMRCSPAALIRLKASEHLAKSSGMFITRHEHSGNLGLKVIIDYGDEDGDE